MKIAVLALALVSFNSFAAEVVGAKLDAQKKNILVSVAYGGGCKEHKFSLEVSGCFESFPVQCRAKLVHKVVNGPDLCEAYIHETVKISLKKSGLTDSYYQGGSLLITGDRSFTNEESSATVVLP